MIHEHSNHTYFVAASQLWNRIGVRFIITKKLPKWEIALYLTFLHPQMLDKIMNSILIQ